MYRLEEIWVTLKPQTNVFINKNTAGGIIVKAIIQHVNHILCGSLTHWTGVGRLDNTVSMLCQCNVSKAYYKIMNFVLQSQEITKTTTVCLYCSNKSN